MNDIIQPPVAKAQMLVRRPVAEVFEAFIDPALTSRFWFSKASGGWHPAPESAGTGRCMACLLSST